MDAIDQLETQFGEILELIPSEFDSHDFTLKLAREHEQLYVRALAHYVDNPHPVRTVNAQLAQRLSQGDYLVEKQGKVRSPNIFGHSTVCEKWRRV